MTKEITKLTAAPMPYCLHSVQTQKDKNSEAISL